MNDDLIKVWIVFLELLESVLFVDIEHLLLNPNPLPFLFLNFLLQIKHDHVSQRWLGLDCSDFCEPFNDNILQHVLQIPSPQQYIIRFTFFLQMIWQTHNVVKRELLVGYDDLLLKAQEFPLQSLMFWYDVHQCIIVKNCAY